MDEAQTQHLLLVLGNITSEVTIDWAEVAKVRKITRKDNATTAFKGMMKKFGIEYANNKFTLIDPEAVATAIEKKPKATTPRKRKPKATEEDAEGKSDSASPKKKQKNKKTEEDVEVAEAAKDAEGDEEE